jgi:hypothetical protein
VLVLLTLLLLLLEVVLSLFVEGLHPLRSRLGALNSQDDPASPSSPQQREAETGRRRR